MRNHRARGAVRRADWGFRGTRFDAFCLRASQSIKNQMCLNSSSFDNCLIMLRSATATKQLGDSVRRCQKTESGAATGVASPRHAGGEHRRAATRYVRSGASINFRRCRRSSTSTSREKNHASAAGAGPTGASSDRRGSCGTGTSRIENGSSSERTLHQNESRTSKMGKQRAAEQVEILEALTLSIGSTRDCTTSG